MGRIPENVRQEVNQTGGTIGRWALRSAKRFVAWQPVTESHRYSDAADSNIIAREGKAAWSFAYGVAAPLSLGLYQSAVGEIPLIGGALTAGAFLMDMAAWGGGVISLPVLGGTPTLAYRAIVSGLTEALPKRNLDRVRSRRG